LPCESSAPDLDSAASPSTLSLTRTPPSHHPPHQAVVLGASLFAANLSTSFRLRKFGMSDLSMFGVQMSVDEVRRWGL
jgi:hypothetical protein